MKKTKSEQHPKIVVGALIFNDKNQIFLGQSKKWDDKWVVPGGHLDWGEKLLDCVRREVKEETGLRITNIEFLGAGESIFSKEYHNSKHMVFLTYTCRAVNKKIKLNDEIQKYVWIKPQDALKTLKLATETAKSIKESITCID